MAFFKRKSKSSDNAGEGKAFSPRFNYYPPSALRVGGMPLQREETESASPDVSRLNAGGLIGASALDSATYKGSHLRADVFSELSESMGVIEEKFHAGMYDAQAMPLVGAFLGELHELANIEVERGAINDCRVTDMKEANRAAYEAVFEARCQREMGIEAARLASLDYMTPDYEEVIARAEEKRERKEARRAARYARQDERRAARAERQGADNAERLASWGKKREERAAKNQERQEKRQEALLQKQQAKMERVADKQRIARQQAQQKLEDLRRAEEAREAEARVRQAQAEADIEQAKALAQSARTEGEKARLEELQARAAQMAFDEREGATAVAESAPDLAPAALATPGEGVEPDTADDGQVSNHCAEDAVACIEDTACEPGERESLADDADAGGPAPEEG